MAGVTLIRGRRLPSSTLSPMDRLAFWTGRYAFKTALTADAVLGAQLVWRHRSVWMAVALGGIVTVLLRGWGVDGLASGWPPPFLTAGALAAVAGSRVLARGGALELAGFSPVHPGIVVAGRFLGAVGLVAPVAFVWAVLGNPAASAEPQAWFRVELVSLALVAVSMGLTVLVGPILAAASLVSGLLLVTLTPLGLKPLFQPNPGGGWVSTVLFGVIVMSFGLAVSAFGVELKGRSDG